MNTETYTLRDTFRSAYRGTRSAYGKECLKLAVAVLAKEITREEFDERMTTLDRQYGKPLRPGREREVGEDDGD